MSKKYFVDKDHKIMNEYYDFIDSEQKSPEETEKEMKKFIEKDPLFLDSYLILFELYQYNDDLDKANEISESAYEKAIKLITDKKGNWSVLLPEYFFLKYRLSVISIHSIILWN
jgi:hypothetical protein